MVSKLRKLQGRGDAIIKALRELDTKAAEEERSFTDEEQSKYNALKEELKEVKVAVAREKELQELERAMIPDSQDGAQSQANRVDPDSGAVRITDDPPPAKAKDWDSFGGYLQAVAFAATNPASLWDERLRESAVWG